MDAFIALDRGDPTSARLGWGPGFLGANPWGPKHLEHNKWILGSIPADYHNDCHLTLFLFAGQVVLVDLCGVLRIIFHITTIVWIGSLCVWWIQSISASILQGQRDGQEWSLGVWKRDVCCQTVRICFRQFKVHDAIERESSSDVLWQIWDVSSRFVF